MNTENLRNSARVAFDRELLKQNLKVTMDSRLVVNYEGGVFTVTRELISFLHAYENDKIYILDDYNIPICAIANELLKLCKQRYQEIMNEWHIQYDEQTRIRTAKNI